MATLYLGRPRGSSQVVAIKRLLPAYIKDPDFVAMFLDEAHLTSRIRHPNVAATKEVLRDGDDLFLVLEYVHGESLSALRHAADARGETIPSPIVVAIIGGVLRGLHAAHEATDEEGRPLHIVHRDVSPQNILVGADGAARIIDFGIAKAVGRLRTTRDGSVRGKLAYMPPEQISGGKVDRRSDVYAAGIVLWELLVGKRLFGTGDPTNTMLEVLERVVEPPSSLAEGISRALDAVTLRALRREPSQRFATALDMVQALESALPPAPPSAVAAWVSTLASDALAARAQQVRAFTKEAPAVPSPPAPSVEATVPARRRRRVVMMAIPIALLLLGISVAIAARRSLVVDGESPTPSATEAVRAAAVMSVETVVDAPPAAARPPEATSAAPTPPLARPVTYPKRPTHASPAPSPSNCNPHYTLDKDGVRVPKPWCLEPPTRPSR